MKIPSIQISGYNYPLPSDRIAKYPLSNRDESKLLTINNDIITDYCFKHLPELLTANTLLVFNNTKVIKARLQFKKPTGACIEIFCLEPYNPADAALAFQQTQQVEWHCMVGNLKKWKEGVISTETVTANGIIKIEATLVQREADGAIIRFNWNNPTTTFADLLETMGQTPIPPYLERKAEAIDSIRYQTVYSKYDGSVAAPTAGLHFSKTVLDQLAQKGIQKAELTLHVGAGTFKPVKSENITQHEMHTEHFVVTRHTLEQLINHDGPIIAVGTTSVRTLESLYIAGVKCAKGKPFDLISQWNGFNETSDLSVKESLQTILDYLIKEHLDTFKAATTIMIAPGYEFKVIDGLITNFHQPKNTLLLLIAALIGENWEKVYDHALTHNYRFLSYGDSSLLMKHQDFSLR
jgi:S-adenosylmethionine:tRNA ribosyltransferase-isomerase